MTNATADQSTFIIAEVGQNHDGSLGLAHAFVDAVAATGATAIKFQTHIADAESTPDEPFRIPFSYEDKTRYEYWKRMEFTAEQWQGLKTHAEEKGLVFMSSPFSLAAVDLLDRLDVCAWKIGSGEIGSVSMLQRMAQKGRRMFVSTGMSDFEEIDDVVEILRTDNADFTLLQCTSAYPADLEDIGLNVISQFKSRYGCPAGLSDHSGTIFPGLAAAALGADCIEVHVTLSREMFGPDIASSISTQDLALLVDGVHAIERMHASPVDKDAAARRLQPMRALFVKSAVTAGPLAAGHRIGPEDVVFKKPGGGISERAFRDFFGKPLARSVDADTFLKPEDFE